MEPKNKSGFTPLIQAAATGDADTVRFLLETGADVNARDNQGRTALTHAVKNAHYKVIENLVEAGANIEAKDASGATPLKYAQRLNDPALLGILTGVPRDVSLKTPVQAPVQAPRHIVRREAVRRRFRLLFLYVAVIILAVSVYKLRNMQRARTATAVMSAIDAGKSQQVNTMLLNGLDPNIASLDGTTALMFAANSGRIEIVRTLFKYRADPNLPGTEGIVGLKRAGMLNPDIVDAFLDAGADPNKTDKDGKTLLAYVCASRGDPQSITHVIVRLLKHGAKPNVIGENGPPLVSLVETGAPGIEDAVSELLARGADPNAVDSAGNPMLVWLASAGKTDLIKLLVTKGANINVHDRLPGQGHTPLQWAAMAENTALVRFLVEHGADVNAADADGETAVVYALAGLDQAGSSADQACNEIVRLLIDKGANLRLRDKQQRTPLQFARQKQLPRMAGVLLNAGSTE